VAEVAVGLLELKKGRERERKRKKKKKKKKEKGFFFRSFFVFFFVALRIFVLQSVEEKKNS